MKRAWVAASFAIAGAVIACSLATDLSGLSGGAAPCDACLDSPPPPTDGGPDDVATRDVTVDAVMDGSADADGETVTFCETLSPKPLFCDDFDKGQLAARWMINLPEAGKISLDPNISLSPPRSLLDAIENGGDPVAQAAYLRSPLQPPAATWHLSYDVWFDELEPVGYITEIDLAAPRLSVYLNAGQFSVSFSEIVNDLDSGQYTNSASLPILQPLIWNHIDIALTFPPGGGGQAAIKFNGQAVLTGYKLHPSWSALAGTFSLGYTYVNPPVQQRRMHFDNVVFDTK